MSQNVAAFTVFAGFTREGINKGRPNMIARQRKIRTRPATQLRSIPSAGSPRKRLDDPFYEPTILDAAEDLLSHLSAPAHFVLGQAREFGFDIRLPQDRAALSSAWVGYVIVYEKYDLAIALEKAPDGYEEAICYIDALTCWFDRRNNGSRMHRILERECASTAKTGVGVQ
ncbi:hypothetical protein [Hyphomicrobium sp.]|uniref:hypothetical protein n=1 Tax=Hyphomicrobium sp. TaxID=82 RepID=UPI002D77FE94|nr:hypothetical protein [Hyphomicrobium sp.]HET6388221.1 hypothetical protein [Hyphomicrobium sp.]